MTTYPPGEFPRSALVEVEKGCLIALRQARAYRRVKAAFQDRGKTFTIVDNTSAYRSAALQNAMHDASISNDRALKEKYNLNPDSIEPLAKHPNGSHEDGRSIDVLVNGSSNLSAADRALLLEYGWVWQFGTNDPNHFRHDDIHAVVPVTRAWCIANHLYVG